MRVLFIDNLDSFAYNLVEEFEKKDCEVLVYRSDVDMKVIEKEIKDFKPKLIVIGSGASLKDSGVSMQIIEDYYKKIPIFGVGLGNECIIESLGGKVGKAPSIPFGEQSKIFHDGKTIYQQLPNPFEATRYHSLIIKRKTMPGCLEITATTEDGTIMGIRHKEYLVEGVQFHPESILTSVGKQLLGTFINLV